MPRKLKHTIIRFLYAFDPNEWCVKCSVFSEGFEPNRPLSHESCALSKTMASCQFADYIAIFLSIFNKKKIQNAADPKLRQIKFASIRPYVDAHC